MQSISDEKNEKSQRHWNCAESNNNNNNNNNTSTTTNMNSSGDEEVHVVSSQPGAIFSVAALTSTSTSLLRHVPASRAQNTLLDDNQPKVSNVTLYGQSIVALTMDNVERLCLAQISNTLLHSFSYNEIHNRRVALGITCVQCTPVQLELLRRAGAMPVSSRRCGMITRREAERLCKSFLGDNSPPVLPEDFTFSVEHRCAWGCQGLFYPSRYNSSRAKCIKCCQCSSLLSPNKFIFHSHRTGDGVYVQPDAANFNSWRRHIGLTGVPSDDTVHAWEDVKAMFNGGSRKRSATQNGNMENSKALKRLALPQRQKQQQHQHKPQLPSLCELKVVKPSRMDETEPVQSPTLLDIAKQRVQTDEENERFGVSLIDRFALPAHNDSGHSSNQSYQRSSAANLETSGGTGCSSLADYFWPAAAAAVAARSCWPDLGETAAVGRRPLEYQHHHHQLLSRRTSSLPHFQLPTPATAAAIFGSLVDYRSLYPHHLAPALLATAAAPPPVTTTTTTTSLSALFRPHVTEADITASTSTTRADLSSYLSPIRAPWLETERPLFFGSALSNDQPLSMLSHSSVKDTVN